MKLKLFLVAVMVAALVVGCGQKKGWREKHINNYDVCLLESNEVVKNDTLNGRALFVVSISPDKDTSYSIYLPSKSQQYLREEYMEIDDYVVINNKKYLLPLHTAWTIDAVPELGIFCGYEISLDLTFDGQVAPKFLSMPKIEVSYHHHNETPIKMTFVAE